MKVENKAPSTLSDVESLISISIKPKTVLNLSGIIKRSSSDEYCFKISCNNLGTVRILKELLAKHLSRIHEVKTKIGYFDKEARQ